MECADILIAAGHRSTSPSTSSSWQPGRQWRKARTVIRTCHRLARLGILSAGVLLPRSTASYVAIKIHHDGSDTDAHSSVNAADDELFKGLVKEKREDCFRRLGGGAGIAAALASDAERGIRGDADDVRRRRESFGGNTYPKPKPKSFFSYLWDALKPQGRPFHRARRLHHRGARLVRQRWHLPRGVPRRRRVRRQQPHHTRPSNDPSSFVARVPRHVAGAKGPPTWWL